MEVRIGSAGGGKRGGMPSWRVFWCYHAVMSLSNIHESSQRGSPARLARLSARLSRLAAMFCRHHHPQSQSTVDSPEQRCANPAL